MPGLAAAAVGFLVSAGVPTALAAFAVNIAGSMLTSTIASRLLSRGAPGRVQTLRELAVPSEVPVYRYVYGRDRVPGSPIAYPVKGATLYGAWLLNSRPSDGGFTIYLDEREVTLTGDPYDFAGPGATATNAPFAGYLRAWIQRGSESSPPAAFLAEAPHGAGANDIYWKASDGGQGLTILWLALDAGPAESQADRWPSMPPAVEVEGRYSLVWNPETDQTIWTQNQALCVLDALRTNPVQPYSDDNLLLDQFIEAAQIAGDLVPRKVGDDEIRYAVGGVVVFRDGVPLDALLAPMFEAGAALPVRIAGRLGILPGAYQTPVATVADFIAEDGMQYAPRPVPEDLPNEWRVTYVARDRGYEQAALRPYRPAGALFEDAGRLNVRSVDLSFVNSPTQAMRVRKILAARARAGQRSLSLTAPPDLMRAVAGSGVQVSLPAPYDAVNGEYMVQAIQPGFDTVGAGGVALRCPVQMISTAASVYDYDPQVDEEDYNAAARVIPSRRVTEPGPISATSNLSGGAANGESAPHIRFAFDPSPSVGVTHYEWEFRPSVPNVYQFGGRIMPDTVDGTGKIFGYLLVLTDLVYDIRVRAVRGQSRSEWVNVQNLAVIFALTTVQATALAGAVQFTGTAPAASNFAAVRVFRTPTETFNKNTPLGIVPADPGATFDITVNAPAGAAFFWAVPRGALGYEGFPQGPFSLTIT